MLRQEGGIVGVYGSPFSTGDTPLAAAELFRGYVFRHHQDVFLIESLSRVLSMDRFPHHVRGSGKTLARGLLLTLDADQ